MGGLAIKIHSEPLPLPSTMVSGLSPAVDAWFQRACSRPVPDRFATAKEMAETLAAALGGEMPRSVDLPRSSTGANASERKRARAGADVTFAAGATTEAGFVAGTPLPSPAGTRNRVLAVIAFGAVLCIGTFVAVSAIRKNDGGKQTVNVLTADPTPATVAPPVSKNIEPTPPASIAVPVTAATVTLPVVSVTAPVTKVTGRHPPRISTSPSARPLLPSASPVAPPPVNSGHDIF
jgi:serine/threonine-protein kinase